MIDVLVTGGTGFIGSYVCRAVLDSGRSCCAYDVGPLSDTGRFILGPQSEQLTVETGSVEDWARLLEVMLSHRPRQVIHLATITNPVLLMHNPQLGINVNFGGTINVLEATRLLGVEQLVYFSSIGVLPACQYEPIDAAHPIFLADEAVTSGVYGATKIAGEAFCFAYQKMYGVDFRTIRPSAVYGFGMQWPIYVKPMVEGAVAGEKVSFPSGARFPRDYTHVSDVASLAVTLLDAPADSPRIFYGATGDALVTAGEVAKLVMELVPGSEIEIADEFSADDLLELAYRGKLDVEPNRLLGWERQFPIRDGLADYIERYRSFLHPQP